MPSLEAFHLLPQYHHRVWGGYRLRPGSSPVGEAWVVHEANRIADGPAAGQSLAELTARYGADLLGHRFMRRHGPRFPLLIKFLDTSAWLSIQVHPDDRRARQLEGPSVVGKTEAWHILEAASGAQVIRGLRSGVERAHLTQAIQTGTLPDLVEYHAVAVGETIFIPAGTVHALGPGLMVYEIQQASDITYRVFDWNRPQTDGRALHIEQALVASDLEARSQVMPAVRLGDDERAPLMNCPFFTLELVVAQAHPTHLDTRGESFHALTVIDGQARVMGDGWDQMVSRLETILIPAATGAYVIQPRGPVRLLKATAG